MKRRLIKLISIMLMVASMISSVTTYAVGCDPVDVPANTCETSEGSGKGRVPYGPHYIYRTEYRQKSGANNTEGEIDHVGCIKTDKSCEAVLEHVTP